MNDAMTHDLGLPAAGRGASFAPGAPAIATRLGNPAARIWAAATETTAVKPFHGYSRRPSEGSS